MATTEREWQVFVHEFGLHVRAMRELLGWSQQQLGKTATVSQGCVSRIEAGTHTGLPFLSALKLVTALAGALPKFEGAVSPTMRSMLELAQDIRQGPMPASDTGFATLIRRYHSLTEGHRVTFLRLAVPIAEALFEASPYQQAVAARHAKTL